MAALLRRCRCSLWLLLVVSLVGCMVPAATREAIVPIIAEITAESCQQQLQSLVALGPRFAGDADETRRSVEYIEKRLRQLGYQVQREAVGPWRGVEQVNLIVEIEGLVDPTTVVEVGAHYDTVRNCPGADDNGSGVAGLLEIARVLVHHRPERTVRMCFFAAEEVGLVGSRAHVDRILADSSRRVDGLLDLEMIGYRVHEQGSQDAPVRIPLIAAIPHQGDFILVAGNFQSGGLGNIFERCVDRYVPGLKYFSANRIAGFFGDAARSDHYPYWQAGLRGIMLTDTANFRNPHYHRRTDTIDTIDFEFLCAVSRATAAAVIEWGGRAPEIPDGARRRQI
ncbi:MAG: M20/M25/M40 family metallo-hydrolase, partial [Planctomycetota bacterium]